MPTTTPNGQVPFLLVGRLARLGWTRFGSPGIFGVPNAGAVCRLADMQAAGERHWLGYAASDRSPKGDAVSIIDQVYEEKVPLTPCPDWCELPDHAETSTGKWHEGAITALKPPGLYCDVSEGHDMDGAFDLRLSISADTGEVSAAQAREFATGLLRAAELYEQLAGAR